MRGHITKRSKDSYTIVVPLGRDQATGKYKQHWETVLGRKVDAEKRLAELQTELFRGLFVKQEKMTVAEYLIDWLDNTARHQIAPRTYFSYEAIIKTHLIPGIGKHPLSNLTGTIIQKYYSKEMITPCAGYHKGIQSANSVRAYHRVLHRALKSAVVKRLISHNPAGDTEPPVPVKKEFKSMTESQLMVFLKELKGDPHYEMFYTILFTGLRRSELLALRWQDIDLDSDCLTVNRVVHYIKGEFVFWEPKTEKSKATISLTPSNATILTDYKQRRIAEYLMLGKEFNEAELVFCHSDGSPIFPDFITKYWKHFVDRIGLSGIRLHDARHTHATLMIKKGVNIKVVQERLRHSNVQTTLNIYSHVLPGMQEEAAQIFDDAFAPE